MPADAPVVSTTCWSSGQGCASITAESPGSSWKVSCWFVSCHLLSANGYMRHFLFLLPPFGKAWNCSAYSCTEDLLSARGWCLLALIPMGQRDSEMNTPTDAGCVVHWKPEEPSFCLRQGYAFATYTLPGERSIFFPVGSIRSMSPASKPPEFAAGDDKCTDTVPDGGVHHAPYGRQQQGFREFAKVQE